LDESREKKSKTKKVCENWKVRVMKSEKYKKINLFSVDNRPNQIGTNTSIKEFVFEWGIC
jgi:hypothetical protein